MNLKENQLFKTYSVQWNYSLSKHKRLYHVCFLIIIAHSNVKAFDTEDDLPTQKEQQDVWQPEKLLVSAYIAYMYVLQWNSN